jgi:hypothetical protein
MSYGEIAGRLRRAYDRIAERYEEALHRLVTATIEFGVSLLVRKFFAPRRLTIVRPFPAPRSATQALPEVAPGATFRV